MHIFDYTKEDLKSILKDYPFTTLKVKSFFRSHFVAKGVGKDTQDMFGVFYDFIKKGQIPYEHKNKPIFVYFTREDIKKIMFYFIIKHLESDEFVDIYHKYKIKEFR